MNDILKDVSMAHRIVVKVGTSTLTYEHGTMNLKLIDRLSMVLSDLRNQGKEIILVSSGAQGIALGKLGLAEKPKDTKGKQAIAAVGQCELMYLYDKMFSGYNNTVAQVLLTREDIAIPRRKRNIQNTVTTLIEMGIIPVVNENDTVSYRQSLPTLLTRIYLYFSPILTVCTTMTHTRIKTQNYFLQYTILTKSEMLQAVREQAEVRAVW